MLTTIQKKNQKETVTQELFWKKDENLGKIFENTCESTYFPVKLQVISLQLY